MIGRVSHEMLNFNVGSHKVVESGKPTLGVFRADQPGWLCLANEDFSDSKIGTPSNVEMKQKTCLRTRFDVVRAGIPLLSYFLVGSASWQLLDPEGDFPRAYKHGCRTNPKPPEVREAGCRQ